VNVADRDIAVKFTGDTRDLERASDKAERSIGDTGKSMGSSLAGLAGPAAIAAGAVAGIAVVGWDLASAAMEDEAAAGQLAQQLKQAAGASDEAVAGAENYITALSKSAAVADDELRPALAKLATATGDTQKAQDLLALATDISAGSGKDLGTVTDALSKAALGSTAGLAKLGIATKDADGNAMSLEDTLAKARDTFHGAGEAAADTSAGGMKAAGIAFDELKESAGAQLLPILGAVAGVFTDKVIPAGEAIVAWATEEWPKIMEEIAPDLADLQATFAEVFANISAFWEQWGDTILHVAVDVFQFWVRWIVAEIKAFAAITAFVIDAVQWWWENWGTKVLTVIGWVIAAVGTVADFIGKGFAAIGWVIGRAIDVFNGLVTMWGAIKDAVGRGVDFVRDLMGGFGDRIKEALGGVADIITKPFKAAFNAISDLWNNTIGKLSFTFPDWIPGMGGHSIDVPDIPRFSTFGALTIVMPPGTDGYDVSRQLATFERNVAPVTTAVAVR
jgi:hypothetical protein